MPQKKQLEISNIDTENLLDSVHIIFEELIPFNKLLGLKIESLEKEKVRMKTRMRDDLVGNYAKGILHGGVISSILDVTGGITALMGYLDQLKGLPREEVMKKFKKLGTIDLRIDYLRPGTGTCFISTGTVLRTGKKVTVTRMELYNDSDQFIAAGTGTYIVG